MSGKSTKILAVDTGGTFTDLLLLDRGELVTMKLPSTPRDPAEAVLAGIRTLLDKGDVEEQSSSEFLLLHGSTVATNALLERKGARVVLITNRGFEDVIEIGRQNRPQLYALVGSRPAPLVDRTDRLGIQGRMDHLGAELEPLDPEELRKLAIHVREADVVAISLLHSYANAEHESAVAKILTEALAEAEVPWQISSDLLPEYREYERTSTLVANAYVSPLTARYLSRIDREGGASSVRIMGSNGGALPISEAIEAPIHTVLSGPTGGVVGALAVAQRSGYENVITFDMGGTSTDVSLCPGRLLHTREFQIDGQPVAIPVIDIHTVGAGGGSLARVDPGGALRVGPQSAGAVPGPICYGLGGAEVTVTDAHVWNGRLPSGGFLGGERTLDRESVRPRLRALADALGMSLEDSAEGILAVADSAMERALRVISVERGFDPKDFVLVAFGGAGGLHVAELADRIGMQRAIVPPVPGLLSAYGMLVAPIMREASRSILLREDEPTTDDVIENEFRKLEDELRDTLSRGSLGHEDPPSSEIQIDRWVEARYLGQSFELRVKAEDWRTEFHRAHLDRYGYTRQETPVEAVTIRMAVTTPGPEMSLKKLPPAEKPPSTTSTEIYHLGEWIEGKQVWRDDLHPENVLAGPALVLEYSSTTWIPPDWSMEVDSWGSLHLTKIKAERRVR